MVRPNPVRRCRGRSVPRAPRRQRGGGRRGRLPEHDQEDANLACPTQRVAEARCHNAAASLTRTEHGILSTTTLTLLLSSQFWPIPSMSRRVINCAQLCLSHPFSRKKWIGQWAVDPDPVLTCDHIDQNWEDSNPAEALGCTSQNGQNRLSSAITCLETFKDCRRSFKFFGALV